MKLTTPSGEHALISGIKLDIEVNYTILDNEAFNTIGRTCSNLRYKPRYCNKPLNSGISGMWPANFVSLKLTDF